MTVKELIQQLQQLDSNLYVFTHGYEGGYEDVVISDIKEMALDVNKEWYYGPHELINEYNDSKIQDKIIVKGVIL